MTALEFRKALREAASDPRELEFLGVESDPVRVDEARGSLSVALVDGFDLPGDNWHLIRAMNVLRAYQPDEVADAWREWSSRLSRDGALIEGSTDPDGHLATVVEIGPDATPRRLVFMTDFERGFAPIMFRDWLPRQWRRGLDEADPVYRFLRAWQDTFELVHEPGATPGCSFENVATEMGLCWSADAGGAYLEWEFENNSSSAG